MKRLLLVFPVCFVMLVLVSGAFAQQAKPCAGDIAKFCGDVKPGEGQITKCLKKNKDQLSPDCKTQIVKAEKALKEVHRACEDDVTMFCAGVKPGAGRVLNCLKEHEAELSSKCQDSLTKVKEKKK
jgi:hypothetical protein